MARNITINPPQSINDLRNEIAVAVLDPDRWMITPNDQLGGREPIDLSKACRQDDTCSISSEPRGRQLCTSVAPDRHTNSFSSIGER